MHEAPHKEGQKRGKAEAIVIVKYLHGRWEGAVVQLMDSALWNPPSSPEDLSKLSGWNPVLSMWW